METDIHAIRSQFDAVLKYTASREDVSDWARELREADDRGELTIANEADRPRIWDAIIFLNGVDLKDSPSTYLHNEEDIIRKRP